MRYIHEENIEEELLFRRSLKSHTKGEDIFFKVDEFFTTADLQWENCVGLCTDDAGAMVGKRAGFVSKVKERANPEQVTFTHCMIHREALANTQISLDLDIVLLDVIKICNCVETKLSTVVCLQIFARNKIQIIQAYQCIRKSGGYREATVYKGYYI